MDDMHTFPDCPPTLAATPPLMSSGQAAASEDFSRNDETGGYLNGKHVEAIVRAAETALEVRRRYQFFVWTQSNLQALLPHQFLACGAYQRQRRELQFELFNNVAVSAELQSNFSDGRSTLLQALQQRWVAMRCKPRRVSLAPLLDETGLSAISHELLGAGYTSLLVHGVSRPQRPAELESFFVLAQAVEATSLEDQARQSMLLELLTPYLHGTWQRVQTVERELQETPQASKSARQSGACGITEREREILGWLREGMSNLQIGVKLGISALTVTNHVQKILRKLNAANRAQAVARAMSMNLLGRSPSEEAGERQDA